MQEEMTSDNFRGICPKCNYDNDGWECNNKNKITNNSNGSGYITVCTGFNHKQNNGKGFDVNKLSELAHANAKEKGWWDKKIELPVSLMLIVSELAEAMEEYRKGKLETYYQEDGKPEGFWTELADVFIRMFDLVGGHNIDIEKLILEKMEYNKKRSYRHGNKVV